MAEATNSVQIPGVDFAELARVAISAQITKAMLGTETILGGIVASALTAKVGSEGVPSNYASENKYAFAEWVAHDLIRKATVEVLKEKIGSMRPALEKEIEAALRRSLRGTAKAMVDCFVKQAQGSYRLSVNIDVAENR